MRSPSVAREQVAALLNCDPAEIIWTSGATESDNLVLCPVNTFTVHGDFPEH